MSDDLARELKKAMMRLLRDWRTEGCPDPECLVCARSRAAEQHAREVMAKVPDR